MEEQNSTPENDALSPQTSVEAAPAIAEKVKNDEAVSSDKMAVINLSQLTMNYIVIAVVFLGIGVLMGRLIFGGTGSSVDMTQIRAAISEAVAQSGSGGAQVSATALADDDPAIGPEDAPVTIVEFSDFNCAYCDRFATQTLQQIIDTYGDKVRFVYRDLPIIGGQESVNSAIAAECAADQGKFWEYHNLLFANLQARGRDVYVGFATEMGMDTNKFTACLDDPAKLEEVRLDYVDGQSLDITGTPHFLVNNRRVSGAQSIEVFKAIINQELQAKGVDVTAYQG